MVPTLHDGCYNYKKQSFFSSINFIDDLTDISKELAKSENKKEFLIKSLQRMNVNLPATAYIPIISKFQRNYMILNICEEESKMIVTAEKVPYLMCIEVF